MSNPLDTTDIAVNAASFPLPTTLETVYGVGAYNTNNVIVNEWSILGIAPVWRGVTFLTGTIAGLPRSIMKQEGNLYAPQRHPLNALLQRRINPKPTTGYEGFRTAVFHSIIWGNGYMLVQRDTRGNPIALWNLDQSKIIPFRYEGESYYAVKRSQSSTDAVIFDAADMIHLKGLSYDDLQGYSLASILKETLQWARSVIRFQNRYFARGTQVQGGIEVPAGLTNDQIEQLKDGIRRKNSGMESDYGMAILTNGAKFSNTTIDPQKSQLIETNQQVNIAIAQCLGINPWYLYEQGRATWGNSPQIAEDFVKFDLRLHVEPMEDQLTEKLLTDKEKATGLVVRLDVNDLLRGDPIANRNSIIGLINNGIINAQEARAELGYLPSGDPNQTKMRIPINFPVELEQTEPAPALPAPTPAPATLPQQSDEDTKRANHSAAIDLTPLIEDAVSRVETKTAKAFSNKGKLSEEERQVWANRFSDEQRDYVLASLKPLVLAGAIDDVTVTDVADRYAGGIREQAASGQIVSLLELLHAKKDNLRKE